MVTIQSYSIRKILHLDSGKTGAITIPKSWIKRNSSSTKDNIPKSLKEMGILRSILYLPSLAWQLTASLFFVISMLNYNILRIL